jgi:hypothetical protein
MSVLRGLRVVLGEGTWRRESRLGSQISEEGPKMRARCTEGRNTKIDYRWGAGDPGARSGGRAGQESADVGWTDTKPSPRGEPMRPIGAWKPGDLRCSQLRLGRSPAGDPHTGQPRASRRQSRGAVLRSPVRSGPQVNR